MSTFSDVSMEDSSTVLSTTIAPSETSTTMSTVDMSQYAVYIDTTQASTIGRLFEALHANVGSINIWFTPQNLTSMSHDATGQCVSFLRLDAKNFDTWYVEQQFMAGICVPVLYKLIKDSIKAKNTMSMFVRKNEQRFYFKVNNTTSSDSSYVPLLMIHQPDIRLPLVNNYATMVSLSSNAFLQYCKTCGCTQTEVIRLSTSVVGKDPSQYTLTIESVGLQNPAGKSITIGTSQDGLIFRTPGNEDFSGLFTLRLCHNIAKSCAMSDHVHILMQPGNPVLFQYDSGNLGQLKYFLFQRDEDVL